MRSVVVSAALANRPGNGGGASVRLTWVAALRRLGFDVWFVEQMDRDLATDGDGRPSAADRSVQAEFFRESTRLGGLEDRCALLDEDGCRLVGAERHELEQVASEAELLVNISGHLTVPTLFERFRHRVYVDLDPAFTQFWHAAGMAGSRLAGHHDFFTVGLNVGDPGCSVPTDGIHWRPLPPPVIVEEWSGAPAERPPAGPEPFTTIASWRGSYGRVEHGGRTFGLKAHEFRKFIELPAHLPVTLEIALDIHPADDKDLVELREHGWQVVDPREVAPDPDAYRRYIRRSGAEFSVAQGIYVETRCGWVSDRTVRYLAAGKPALVQDTGLSDQLPVGEGLVAFRTMEDAVAGAEAIIDRYDSHCLGARRLAEELFDADRVLRRFLQEVGVDEPRTALSPRA